MANENQFVAVIHADGNSLGKQLMHLGENGGNYEMDWKSFSIELNKATISAARMAYEEVFSAPSLRTTRNDPKFRPIILGGDDLTVICVAEAAIPFTCNYLKHFKEESAKSPALSKACNLTACAGIAFIKSSYPFHYGIELAEMLCQETKKRAKLKSESPVPSSFMFARELGGFVEKDFSAFKKRELTAGKISFDFGPYCVDDDALFAPASALQEAAEILSNHSPLRGGLRKMLREFHISTESADLLGERIQQITEKETIDKLLKAVALLTGKQSKNLKEVLRNDQNLSPLLDLLLAADFNIDTPSQQDL